MKTLHVVASIILVAGIAAPAGAQTYDWTGFYAGLHLGGVHARYKASGTWLDGDHMVNPLKDTAFIGGVTAGYNYQLTNNIVTGFETDIGLMTVKKRVEGMPVFDDVDNFARLKQDFYADLTGRLGFAQGNFLFYAKGGLALTHMKMETADLINGSSNIDWTDYTSVKKLRAGFTIGGGVEFAFSDAMSAKVEYRYMDFGKVTSGNQDGETIHHRLRNHAITVGVNFKLPY